VVIAIITIIYLYHWPFLWLEKPWSSPEVDWGDPSGAHRLPAASNSIMQCPNFKLCAPCAPSQWYFLGSNSKTPWDFRKVWLMLGDLPFVSICCGANVPVAVPQNLWRLLHALCRHGPWFAWAAQLRCWLTLTTKMEAKKHYFSGNFSFLGPFL
jgi:hypothetical protein